MSSSSEESIETLRRAIARSGLSARQYAKRVRGRDERLLRRWLSGERKIPESHLKAMREELLEQGEIALSTGTPLPR